MSELQTAVAAELEQLPPNTEPAEPITIETEEAPVVQEPPKKKPRPPANVFISQLRNQNTELMSANDRLMQELAEERSRTQQQQEQLHASTQQSMLLHEGKLKAEAETARKRMGEAIAGQDINGQTEATAALARAESGLADVEAWKARQPKEPKRQQEQQPRQQEQRQPAPPQADPATQGWMDENTWFSPMVGGQRNPEFNKTMHLTAVAYASRLEDRYRAEGREKDIASQEYWDEINQHMGSQFPDELGIEPEVVIEPPKKAPPVAPAVRSAAPGTRAPQSQTIKLTGEERQFVDGMRNSGAMVYPSDYKTPDLRGKRMSPNDSYITYWKQKQGQQ